eukprot:4135858-Lingulodinium_polyedra.AAC.1
MVPTTACPTTNNPEPAHGACNHALHRDMRRYLRNGRNAPSCNVGTHLRRAQQVEQRMVPNDAHSTTAQLVTNAFNTGWLRIPCLPGDKTKRQSARAHAC